VCVNSPRGFNGAAALAFVCISHPCSLAVLVVDAISAKAMHRLSALSALSALSTFTG
jgi:hypothetical protein